MENKYIRDLSIYDKNTTDYKVLSEIKPNSRVLELGPAKGLMTRYLKKVLNCNVSIVELFSDDYIISRAISDDGICADLNGDEWINYYKGKTFDYIIIADVLEHLIDPVKVLKKLDEFLIEKSEIIISVPNITHNSILIEMFQDKFEYTKTGLLDNTHISFYTYDRIKNDLIKAGYKAYLIDSVCIEPQNTEIKNSLGNVPQISNQLFNRNHSNVYQYVVKAVKKSTYDNNNYTLTDLSHKAYYTVAFIDYGLGFSDDNYVECIVYKKDDNFNLQIKLENNSNIKAVRIDLIRNFYSDIELISIKDISNKKIKFRTNADRIFEDTYYFKTKESYIYIEDFSTDLNYIEIDFKANIYTDLEILENKIYKSENNEYKVEIEKIYKILNKQSKELNEYKIELSEQMKKIYIQKVELEELNKSSKSNKNEILKINKISNEIRHEINRIYTSKILNLFIKKKER